MRELTDYELKKCQMEVLENIHNYCVAQKLKYYMVYGTLLGAVRHQGYIPWDDDVDIAMPREDYEFLLVNYNKCNMSNSRVISIRDNKDYYLEFAKAYHVNTVLDEHVFKPIEIGAYIDIFLIDNMPDEAEAARQLLNEVQKAGNTLRRKSYIPADSEKKNIKVLAHILLRAGITSSRYDLIDKIDRLGKTYQFQKTEHSAIAVGGFSSLKEYVPSTWYGKPQLLKFEDKVFYAPACAHELLKQWYGDYMTPPPREQQKPHHGFFAY